MNYFWKGIAIAAMWGVVGAIAIGSKGVSSELIIVFGAFALAGTWAVAEK